MTMVWFGTCCADMLSGNSSVGTRSEAVDLEVDESGCWVHYGSFQCGVL